MKRVLFRVGQLAMVAMQQHVIQVYTAHSLPWHAVTDLPYPSHVFSLMCMWGTDSTFHLPTITWKILSMISLCFGTTYNYGRSILHLLVRSGTWDGVDVILVLLRSSTCSLCFIEFHFAFQFRLDPQRHIWQVAKTFYMMQPAHTLPSLFLPSASWAPAHRYQWSASGGVKETNVFADSSSTTEIDMASMNAAMNTANMIEKSICKDRNYLGPNLEMCTAQKNTRIHSSW